jgi:beta-ribofuranosylaminobenzene 5'-phosphate synthase
MRPRRAPMTDRLSVRVVAGSRIHISLADMGFASPRSFGGVGFMLDKPAADVELRHSASTLLIGAKDLDQACQAELAALLMSLTGDGGSPVQVVINGHGLQHVGLGTKTSLKLAVIAGYNHLDRAELARARQQSISGRGGASGIGIHGFFEGGVLWDAGRSVDEVNHLLPSGAKPAACAPLLMLRQAFPDVWRVALCLPSAELSHGVDEQRFFEANAPIARTEALETMALLYHGVLPGFRLAHLEILATALTSLSKTGFKRIEIERCGKNVVCFLEDLWAKGYAAGMSSMGPLIYVIVSTDDHRAAEDIEAICLMRNAKWLGYHSGLNHGAKIYDMVVL